MPGLLSKAKRGAFFDRRATLLTVPDLTGLPSLEGEVDKLIEFEFLVTTGSSSIIREP